MVSQFIHIKQIRMYTKNFISFIGLIEKISLGRQNYYRNSNHVLNTIPLPPNGQTRYWYRKSDCIFLIIIWCLTINYIPSFRTICRKASFFFWNSASRSIISNLLWLLVLHQLMCNWHFLCLYSKWAQRINERFKVK